MGEAKNIYFTCLKFIHYKRNRRIKLSWLRPRKERRRLRVARRRRWKSPRRWKRSRKTRKPSRRSSPRKKWLKPPRPPRLSLPKKSCQRSLRLSREEGEDCRQIPSPEDFEAEKGA